MTRKFDKNRHNVAKKVVRLRTKDLLSWADIAAIIESSPRTARKLFQEARGEGQHFDHIPNRGGRWPSDWGTTAEVPYLPGTGENNDWDKYERPEED
jgi:hypothetical protein